MAGLKLSHVYKVYPNGVKAVNDFSMDIEDKEFIVFVGPSGCGKSTTLRMIAGLEQITSGEISIGETVVNYVEPRNRDIAMVFQNYALYPHMTVYDNMAFSLRIHKLPKDEIERRVKNAAEILGISDYLQRKPKNMSGGQCQRVALGRAIVREPKVFLLDEPLSNLDAKLRTTMRSEISKLHQKLGTTFIYVTHDQVEAMTMGTRIVVMKSGCVQQIDSPANLYRYPSNKFVAGFIGSPQMNFYDGTMELRDDKVIVKFDNISDVWEVPYNFFTKADKRFLDGKKKLTLGLRPEHISIGKDSKYPFTTKCVVSYVEELGTESLVYGDLNIENADSITATPTRIIIKAQSGTEYNRGDIIDISMKLSHLRTFDKETENNIAPRIPQEILVHGEVKDGQLKMLGTNFILPNAIKAANGTYTVTIPTNAVRLGGKIKAVLTQNEMVNRQIINHFKVGNTYLFGLDLPNCEEGDVNLDIDLKQLTLSDNETVIVAPITEYNSLLGKMSVEKICTEREVDGKVKKIKEKVHKFTIADCKIECPEELAMRILTGADKSIFKKELEYRFAPDSVSVEEEGIPATVMELLDYGTEKFAKCKVGENYVIVKVASDFNQENVLLKIDVKKLIVVEKQRDIRLI